MAARLVFLGQLADLAGQAELAMPCPAPLDWAGVLARLPAPLAAALREDRVRIALNGELTAKAALALRDGDELALLPPVSGG